MSAADEAPFRRAFNMALNPLAARNALGALGTDTSYATSADFPSGPWTSWTPTISASSGTLTSSTINTARYVRLGKTIHAFVDVTITNVGTGIGSVIFTLPVIASSLNGGLMYGHERAVTGVMCWGRIEPSGTNCGFAKYDGSGTVVVNYRLVGMAIYEID